MMKRVIAALLLCQGGAVCAADNSFSTVRADIQHLRTEQGIPAISVAVARHGKILWEEGFGWADREKRISATENTMYSLASISKSFTATGLMTLVREGQIDLDKPINDYLGNAKLKAWVGDARDATVRRVAAHSSGLPLHFQFFFADEAYRPPTMDETILRYGNLVTAPGERYEYSNLGYGVLDYVIERVAGQSYADFMRQQVFVPLGLTHTSVGVGPGLAGQEAIRYDETGAPIPPYDTDHPGASAVYSSAHDLIRFGMFHLKDHLPDQKAILNDAALDSMHEVNTPDGTDGGYCLGWVSRERPGGYRAVFHGGGMPGVATLLQLIPSQDIAIVILINKEDQDSLALIRDEILGSLLPKWQKAPKRTRAPVVPFQPGAELTGVWKGTLHTYQKDLPFVLDFRSSGDVHVRVDGQPETLLNNATLKEGMLEGFTTGDIGTGDANRHSSYVLRFSLKLRGRTLNGGVTANGSGPRLFAVTQWTELTKQ